MLKGDIGFGKFQIRLIVERQEENEMTFPFSEDKKNEKEIEEIPP